MSARKAQGKPKHPKPDPQPSAERLLDAAVEMTFPASDPISIEHAYKSASSQDDEADADAAAPDDC
jgi:hypothetical protein